MVKSIVGVEMMKDNVDKEICMVLTENKKLKKNMKKQ
jgi:hypothetical protein